VGNENIEIAGMGKAHGRKERRQKYERNKVKG
jgi:hypothetical protein